MEFDSGLHPRFDVGAFEDFLRRRGRDFLWERSRRCPCQNPRTRSPLETCPQCHGVGWAYTAQGIHRGAILSITANKAWARFGEWLSGDAQLTFSADLLIGDKDRITLQTGEYRESVVLTRGGKEIIPDPTVFDVLECGDDTGLYVPGRDFVLHGAEIRWRGQQPALGGTYSVLYRARPTFMVWLTLPQIRALVRQGFDADGNPLYGEMPRKVALRRWIDFVRDVA